MQDHSYRDTAIPSLFRENESGGNGPQELRDDGANVGSWTTWRPDKGTAYGCHDRQRSTGVAETDL
jgi:hypothetical protein